MDNFDKRTELLVQQYYDKVIKPLLPKAEQGTSSSYGLIDSPSSIEISPNPVNGSLIGSQYEYKNLDLIFIHYTKLKWVKNILRDGKMRMYSLSSMDDEQELSYPLQNIIPDKSDYTIDNYKTETFILSMNEYQENKELIQNWIDYGDNGKGVGIVFQFPKSNLDMWFHHYLSKVYYGDPELEALRQYHIRHADFILDNNVEIKGQVKHFMLPLAAFHKRKGYKDENETRLIVTKNYVNNEIIYNVKLDGHKKYIELELNKERFEERVKKVFNGEPDSTEWSYNSYPIPIIKKIILGPKCMETVKLKKEIQLLSEKGLGYKAEVEKSKIKI